MAVLNLQTYTRQQRYLILVIVVGLLLLLGITVATQIDLSQPLHVQTPEGRELIVSEITLGTLIDPTQLNQKNPKLRQQAAYTTADPLALRITTDPGVTAAFSVGARLLTPEGTVVELVPSSVSFQPGTSSFCCWTVAQPGRYTLQLFRPEKVITSLPLIIEPASARSRPLL